MNTHSFHRAPHCSTADRRASTASKARFGPGQPGRAGVAKCDFRCVLRDVLPKWGWRCNTTRLGDTVRDTRALYEASVGQAPSAVSQPQLLSPIGGGLPKEAGAPLDWRQASLAESRISRYRPRRAFPPSTTALVLSTQHGTPAHHSSHQQALV